MHCEDSNVANLIMVEIPGRLVGYYKIAIAREKAKGQPKGSLPQTTAPELNSSERGPLAYIAGYIVSKIPQKARNRKDG